MAKIRKPTAKEAPEHDVVAGSDEEIDEEIEESFPASDPPSYAGGRHSVGAPARTPGPKTRP
jgi:hypothetical protein